MKVLNKTIIFVVCPNPKCSALYNLNEISVNRGGQQKPTLCKKNIWGKKCSTELSFKKKLSFGRTKMVLFKTFPFLPPSEWIKTFVKQEQFLSLIRNRPETSLTDYRDIWDGKILQQFMVDPEDARRPLLNCKTNLALLLYLDFFNPFQRVVYSCGALHKCPEYPNESTLQSKVDDAYWIDTRSIRTQRSFQQLPITNC